MNSLMTLVNIVTRHCRSIFLHFHFHCFHVFLQPNCLACPVLLGRDVVSMENRNRPLPLWYLCLHASARVTLFYGPLRLEVGVGSLSFNKALNQPIDLGIQLAGTFHLFQQKDFVCFFCFVGKYQSLLKEVIFQQVWSIRLQIYPLRGINRPTRMK